MTEVLKALQELNVCWKKIGHYNMKCRWLPGLNEGMVNNPVHNNHYFGDESTIIENDGVTNSRNVVNLKCSFTKLVREVPAESSEGSGATVSLLGSLCCIPCGSSNMIRLYFQRPLCMDLL
ncbi:SNF1-related protein kinase catalytic subunit alpha KIN10-like [Durio zibethinus]|uniref:SNF1-related protein kinase catalytic subunit alpha KIN10-like n=1 Tax=Durio zibethinus TaxID=66656 RepID=A0A6P6BBP6_DURZI|nr:SNF1-related protein kinase catalytic subunit alpha KIN10-like [Durio zibethinus]